MTEEEGGPHVPFVVGGGGFLQSESSLQSSFKEAEYQYEQTDRSESGESLRAPG